MEKISAKYTCFHCGDSCKTNTIALAEKHFCCEGCKLVYEILNENNLCAYYDLNSNPGITQKIAIRKDKYAFLDDASIAQKIIQYTDGKQVNVTFYLPQMHCSSCLWLLENIHTLNKGIISSRVNFSLKEVFIVFDAQKTSLREVVELLHTIGYEPHLSLHEISKEKGKKVDRSKVYKIGIAGFCFSNIMMMSFPDYFSIGGYMEKDLGLLFKVYSVVLSIPVLFYCATEFFVAAWKGIKTRVLNIDAPIALALVITFGRSMYEILTGTGSGYLDSMSGIVFFMLVGRILQDKTYQSLSFDRDFTSFFPIAVNVVQNAVSKPTPVEQVKVNDVIEVFSNELIPVDAILSKGAAEIDYSFVTGESIPVQKNIGEIIYAGGKQLGGKLELMVVKEVSQSYLTNLWNKEIFKQEKNTRAEFVEMLSKYFTYIIFLISIAAASYWYMKGNYMLMWNTLTTILIIACPCALLLSSTFTNGHILRRLSRNKLYLRNPDVIEQLGSVNHIVFDKTGTLTQSGTADVFYEGEKLDEDTLRRVAALLGQSTHPIAKQVLQSLSISEDSVVENFKLIEGNGIEGWIEEHHLKIGSPQFVLGAAQQKYAASTLAIMQDGKYFGSFWVKNIYRDGIESLLKNLKQRFDISILSGDNDAEAPYLKSILGEKSQLLFNQKPDDKLNYIKQLQEQGKKVLMLGDGLNDAGALRQSYVGIAVAENNNSFTPASDAILSAEYFSMIPNFLSYAASGNKIIVASFIISILYNVIGLYYAVQGSLSPVIAAILMPCSSISIILFTYLASTLSATHKKMK